MSEHSHTDSLCFLSFKDELAETAWETLEGRLGLVQDCAKGQIVNEQLTTLSKTTTAGEHVVGSGDGEQDRQWGARDK